jgi:hypothetical protein
VVHRAGAAKAIEIVAYLQKYSRRRNHRFDRPELVVVLEGLDGRSANWSLGGVAVRCGEGDAEGFAPDGKVSGSLGQPNAPKRFEFEGRVVRSDGDRKVVAVEFTKLSPGAVMLFIDEFRHMIGGAA